MTVAATTGYRSPDIRVNMEEEIKGRGIRDLNILTTNEMEVIERISRFKVYGTCGGVGVISSLALAAILNFVTNGASTATLVLAAGGGVAVGGAVYWYKLPLIMQTFFNQEYRSHENDLFEDKLDTCFVGLELPKSKQNKILLTSFRIENPRVNPAYANALFTAEEVEEMLKRERLEKSEVEKAGNFWRGDFRPDFETVEKTHRARIAYIQEMIENFNSLKVHPDFDAKILESINEKLKGQIERQLKQMKKNFERMLELSDRVFSYVQRLREHLPGDTSIKMTAEEKPGSLELLDSDRYSALTGEFPPTFVKIETRSNVYPLLFFSESYGQKQYDEAGVEVRIRSYVVRHELEDLLENLDLSCRKEIEQPRKIKLSEVFKSRMLGYIEQTKTNIQNEVSGYTKG